MSTDSLLEFLNQPKAEAPGGSDHAGGLVEAEQALRKLEAAVVPEAVPQIGALYDRLRGFRARVSLIGQVKAGKTALTNALLGTPGLLPSDVNPWTSVVTSMHVNVPPPQNKRAIFTFFSEDDWTSMVSDGGRIADLARKAKFDTKLDELTAQIKEMKTRTEARLGRNFKMLLDNQHAFHEYNHDLIKRYVCLGEEDMPNEKEGRFADLTKSADLYLTHAGYPYPVTIADTPGVNDPFLIREAATLASLGSSDICVVVLSAHQALSTVDIGLMRVLMSLQNQRIVVFVNRIDELEDPDTQIKEIDAYVKDILAKQNLPADIPVIFGSALWAEAAMAETTDILPEDAKASLERLIASRQERLSEDADDLTNIDSLQDVSGVTALRAALDADVTTHVAQPFLQDLAGRAIELGERSSLYLRQTFQMGEVAIAETNIDSAIATISKRQANLPLVVAGHQKALSDTLSFAIAAAYRDFITAEKRLLLRHLDSRAALDDWAPDTQTLRADLNAVYGKFSIDAVNVFSGLSREIVTTVTEQYRSLLGDNTAVDGLAMPSLGNPGTPVSLMRTFTIDFGSGVVSAWLKRRLRKESYLLEFEELVLADMRDTLAEMQDKNLSQYCRRSSRTFHEYLTSHADTLRGLADVSDGDRRSELQKKLGVASEVENRLADLATAVGLLGAYHMPTEHEEAAS